MEALDDSTHLGASRMNANELLAELRQMLDKAKQEAAAARDRREELRELSAAIRAMTLEEVLHLVERRGGA